MRQPRELQSGGTATAVMERRGGEARERADRQGGGRRPAGPGRILLATADPREARRIRSILAAGDWDLCSATGGEEALRELTSETELVMLGLPLSGPYGRLIVESLRGTGTRRSALLAIVQENDEEERRRAADAGADQTIARPFDSADLLSRVRGLMELRSLRSALDEARSLAAAGAEELAALRSELSSFAGKLAHDLKNPLTGIMGHAQMLQMKLGSTSPVADGYATKILGSARAIQQALTDARDLGLLGEGRFRMSLQKIDLHAALGMVVKEKREEILAGEADLELVAPRQNEEKGPLLVEADPGLLLRLLGNLVTTATLHSSAQGKVRVMISSRVEGKAEVHISCFGDDVQDLPPGAIRDPGGAPEPSAQEPRLGNGLRMAFCRAVAEAHGGRLWARTNAAGGHTIGLLLRADVSEEP